MELTLKLLIGSQCGQRNSSFGTTSFSSAVLTIATCARIAILVSRHHCVLLVEEGFCAVRDFGSRNGTYVNEERIVGQNELHNGDKIKVGVLEFEVELSSRVGGKKKPKVKDIKDVAQRTAAQARAATTTTIFPIGFPTKQEDSTKHADRSARNRAASARNSLGRKAAGARYRVHEKIADRRNHRRQAAQTRRACRSETAARKGRTGPRRRHRQTPVRQARAPALKKARPTAATPPPTR